MGTIAIASSQTTTFSDSVTLTQTPGLAIACDTLAITLVPSSAVVTINISLSIAFTTLAVTMVPSSAALSIFQSVAPDPLSISLTPSAIPKLIINDPPITLSADGVGEIGGEVFLTDVALGIVEAVGDILDSFAGAQYGIPDQNIEGVGEITGAVYYISSNILGDAIGVGEVTNEAANTVAYFAAESIDAVGEIDAFISSGDIRLADVEAVGEVIGQVAIVYSGEDDITGVGEVTGVVSAVFTLLGVFEGVGEVTDVIATVSTLDGNISGIGEVTSVITDPSTNTVTFSVVIYGVQPKPVMFTNFNFNSLVENGGNIYGANDSGISLIGGNSDEDEKVRSAIRFNESSFGSASTRKRVRSVHLGPYNKNAYVKGISEKRELEVVTDRTGKAIVGRYVNGRKYALEIKDFKELEKLDIHITETN
jgi:hypothetical protein